VLRLVTRVHSLTFDHVCNPQEVANEPSKEPVKANMFGAEAAQPSAESGGQSQPVRPAESVPTQGQEASHEQAVVPPKKANPFV
jgi:hypothetical protein